MVGFVYQINPIRNLFKIVFILRFRSINEFCDKKLKQDRKSMN